MKVELTDNSDKVLEAMFAAKLRALERCGQKAEKYAAELAPSSGKTGQGRLRGDITHRVDEQESAVYIGTNVTYAPYVEMGTGIYADGGRQDPWVYQDDEENWHRTRGVKARPFMKPAVENHKNEYIHIMEEELKGE